MDGVDGTHLRADDIVAARKEEHRAAPVAHVRDVLAPERVRGPVVVPLQEVGDAQLARDEVLDEQVRALCARAVRFW